MEHRYTMGSEKSALLYLKCELFFFFFLLLNNRNLSLLVPEAGNSKIKTLAAGCPHSVTAIFFLCPHVAERVRGFSVISSLSVLVLPFLLYF